MTPPTLRSVGGRRYVFPQMGDGRCAASRGRAGIASIDHLVGLPWTVVFSLLRLIASRR